MIDTLEQLKNSALKSLLEGLLPRSATQSAVMRLHVLCPSVCLCMSVTFRYSDHIGWNSLRIILRPIA